MNTLRIVLIPVLALALFPRSADAQSQTVYRSNPVYHQPMYIAPAAPSVAAAVRDPFAVCDCNPSNPGDCKCKNLDCKIRLPHNCKTSKPNTKTPIPCKIYGKIPVVTATTRCLYKRCEFEFNTEVPQVYCSEESCIEVGKKLIECMPGCCFSVCVPTYQCETKAVECRLGVKLMKMELWARTKNGSDVYDVCVINNPDVQSVFHAGGMPEKWLIMHCGSLADVKARFPGVLNADGEPVAATKSSQRDVKPEATSADVKIKLVVDQDQVQKYADQFNATKAASQKSDDVKVAQAKPAKIES